MVNGTTHRLDWFAAGMFATLYGSNLGPIDAIDSVPGDDGHYPTLLAGVRVTVNGSPAPLLSVQEHEIDFVLPQVLTGNPARICVGTESQSCLYVSFGSVAPALLGNGAVLNQDGTLNTPANPATRGSVISLFGTGFGPYDRVLSDGAVAEPPLALLRYQPKAVFPGPAPVLCGSAFQPPCPPTPQYPAKVLYAGQAPGMITGVTQVNVEVPLDAGPLGGTVVLTFSDPNYVLTIQAQVAVN
jgi:uncharacterized protein (TIGR03437 family)